MVILDADGMPATLPAIVEAQRASLEAIRDEWIRPLVDDLREAERTIGRLEAERDGLAAELTRLRSEQDAPVAAQNGPGAANEGDPAATTPSRPWWRFWRR